MVKIPSKNISKLDLSNMSLTEFPVEILELKNLRKLYLSNNNISVIPREIEKLKNLELLDLSNNNIINFYAKLCSLKKLSVLNLNNNRIKTIPKQITNLKNLKILQLANNKLNSLPKSFSELEKLQKLNVSKNLFSEFPNEILGIQGLESLWLNNLQLKTFPLPKICIELTNLKCIYCYGKTSNNNHLEKDYLKLSKIRGNAITELISINYSYRMNLKKLKTSNKNNKLINEVQKDSIFISYSHEDKEWLDEVQKNLKVLTYNDYVFDLWDDTRIKPGDKWKMEIEKALKKAGIALLIISTDFLASDFIRSNELPTILKNAEESGTKILPLIVGYCFFTKDKHLSIFQSVNDPDKPLNSLSKSDVEKELVNLTTKVSNILLE